MSILILMQVNLLIFFLWLFLSVTEYDAFTYA